MQADRRERAPGVGMPALELAPHRVEHRRRRALEREDRLLFVADREERAPPRARALAGEEILRELAQDVPLRARSVLRLVDQDMIDARSSL